MNDNNRETGARKPVEDHRPAETDQSAGMPGKPQPFGLTEPVDEKPRHSDGQQPSRAATPSPAPEKVSGAGPAIAEHSKDAKAPKSGRQPGAYVKP